MLKKNDFLEDIGIKITAIFLSLIIWFHATTEKYYTYTVELPVSYSYNLPDSLVLISTPPKNVRLRINAKGKTILKLKYTKSLYMVYLGSLDLGKNIVDMTQGAVPQVEDLEIIEVIPKKVLFLVDKYSSKVLYSIKPVFLFDSSKIKVRVRKIQPRSIRVKGPRTMLRTIRFATTDTIKLDTLSSGRYQRKVKLMSPNKYISIIKPKIVELDFTVTRFKYDTMEVLSDDSSRVLVYLFYPDTINLESNSVICERDTITNTPICKAPSYVKILKIEVKE